MRLIDKIKEDLAKISPWPWHVNERDEAVMRPDDYPICNMSSLAYETGDADFIALSPQRIAALVEYVEASEAWFFSHTGNAGEHYERFKKAKAELEKVSP